jgi:PAS domain S-box-containing protein
LRAEEALQRQTEVQQTIFDNIPVMIAFFDREGRPQLVNRCWQSTLGWSLEEARHKDILAEFYPDLAYRKHVRDYIADNAGTWADFKTRIRDGRMVDTSWVNVSLADGFSIGIGIDITERKRTEKKMQMFSQEIIAAREDERKRVSSVLHHDVGSLTVGISSHFEAIEQDLRSGKPGEALQWMKRTRKLFGESVARLKKLAIELRPPELDVLGLRAALRQYFSQVTERGGTRIHFRETLGRTRVPGDTATILFRVAQEALTNAITHGHATRVDVGLSASKEEVGLTVRNNGKGFNPSEQRAQATSQIGLRVMREMAVSVGGTFTIDSGRGKRTTVRMRLPIADCGLRIADLGNPDWSLRIAD